MNSQDPNRLQLLERELTALFLANNRPITQQLMKVKSALLSDTLVGLPSSNISAFFKYVRENEEELPSDGKLLKILRARIDRFGVSNDRKLEAPKNEDDEIPDSEWKKNLFKGMFDMPRGVK